MGVNSSQLSEERLLNLRNLFGLFMFAQHTCSTSAFFLFKAQTFQEYSDSFYISSTALGAALNYTYVVCKMAKVFDLIQNLEKVIEKREFG